MLKSVSLDNAFKKQTLTKMNNTLIQVAMKVTSTPIENGTSIEDLEEVFTIGVETIFVALEYFILGILLMLCVLSIAQLTFYGIAQLLSSCPLPRKKQPERDGYTEI